LRKGCDRLTIVKTALLETLLSRLVGERSYQDNKELFQARLIASFLFVASTTAFLTGLPILFILGDPSGYVTLGFGVIVVFFIIFFRLGLGTTTSFILLELATGVHFLLCRAMQDRIDWPLAVWLSIFPILRLLYGGFRHGLMGILYSSVLALGIYLLEDYSPFVRVPVLEIISFYRAVSLMLAIFVITAVFNALRMEAMEVAEKASKARSLFLANMSHELRTPMNGVIGITELILSGSLPSELRNQLELVHRSGTQMIVLINNILDLTRLESKKEKLESIATDLNMLCHDVMSLLKPSADQKNLEFTLKIDPNIPNYCFIDPTRLKQVLINLLGNALKFTDKGYVKFEVKIIEEQLQFRIIDTGIGITDEVRDRIFSPFEQADLSITRRYGGSGLGLSISQRLVVLMGGQLTVSSNEGEGSVFSFEIPCIIANQNSNLEQSLKQNVDSKTEQRVLLVEDNDINSFVASGMLKRCGCTVTCRVNGEEAVDAVRAEDFDLVLMDCHMPVMDGFEATRQIRNMSTHVANIPIIALTASAMAEDFEACIQSGMNDVLTKPLSYDKLRNILHKLKAKK